jgi:curved DNA-binding protein CbpA
MKPIKSQDYYEILSIPRHASQEDIRRAFELCKHTYQEDSLATYSLFSEEENKVLFALMSQAYEILNDPSSRREYDHYHAQKEGRSSDEKEGERMVASMIGLGSQTQRDSAPPAKSARKAKAPAARDRPRTQKKTKAPPTADTVARDEKFIESVSTFTGQVLKKFRNMKGISLEELSEQTKIRKTYIQYLEEEEYEFLPAPVYIKGFINIIAAVLGLPAQRVADDYMAQFNMRRDA